MDICRTNASIKMTPTPNELSTTTKDTTKIHGMATNAYLKESDVVISGIAGRFPESASVDEFAANLFGKVDMINDDDRRWPAGELMDS